MFKASFKYYKQKCPPPDLSSVIDFHNEISLKDQVIRRPLLGEKLLDCKAETFATLGLHPPEKWIVYNLKSHPGLIVAPGALSVEGQRCWAERCFYTYPKPPNRNNLGRDCSNIFCCQTDASREYEKLRWVTMGYHHDWDTKVYSEGEKNSVPEELVELCKCISGLVQNDWSYVAQAVIVNYYYRGSTLSGHTDHSEPNKSSPIISLSIGQSAVFLIGGLTLDDKVTPLLIRSGDIVIMSGESRLCYHAVPRIVPARVSPVYERSNDHTDYLLRNCRINLNARQVLPTGQASF